jgi:hypothetical protein
MYTTETGSRNIEISRFSRIVRIVIYRLISDSLHVTDTIEDENENDASNVNPRDEGHILPCNQKNTVPIRRKTNW